MDDSLLWAAALGIGGLGFLLLAVAGMVAMRLNTRARSARDAAPTEKPQSHTKDDESQLQAGPSSAQRKTAIGGFWAWVKAWVFASVHAGTVSLVLGGMTFFEDLANASDEIQRTGTVTFPKQLLPGTLSGPASRKRLSEPSGGLSRNGNNRSDDQGNEANEEHVETGDPDQPGGSPPDAANWEVVDPANEAGADPDRLIEDPRPST